MDTWQTEKCSYCGGTIIEKRVDLHRKVKSGHHVLIENVPAGVCTSCGARFYVSHVVHRIEETIRSTHRPRKQVRVPVYSLVPLHNVFSEETTQEEALATE